MMNEDYMRYLLEFLPRGAKNAISMREWANLTGQNLREARRSIYELRCAGAVICSGTDKNGANGYFLPANRLEVEKYVHFQESRIRAAARAVRSARKYLKGGGKCDK